MTLSRRRSRAQVTPDRGFLDAGESVELTIVTTPFQAESVKAGGIVLDVRGDQVFAVR